MKIVRQISTLLAVLVMLVPGSVTAKSDLSDQIKNWKPGDEVPHRLLSFPDGKVPSLSVMRTDAYENSFTVRPYILGIKDDSLLEAIVFDPRSERGALEAAIVTLTDHNGLTWLSKLLSSRNSTRWELDALREILDRRFARCSVAYVAKDAMQVDEAKRALGEIKVELDKGVSWKDAYGSVADKHPDLKRRETEPDAPTTLIGFMYSGWVSADGFDFSSLHFTAAVPPPLFADITNSGKGGKIVSTPSGVYLIYVFEIYMPTS